jgi:two-component system NtrC family sensor kinase
LRGQTAGGKSIAEQRPQLIEKALLEAYQQMPIGLLCSGIAHNINSPLAAIILTAEVGQSKHPEVIEFRDILKAAERIQEIVENLGAKCADEQVSDAMDIDLNDLVRRELDFLQADLFLKHQVKVETNLQSDLPSIRARYVDFSFALFCLVRNALDAMQSCANPVLSLSTSREGESAIALAVRDQGLGMEKQVARRIFDPFFTASRGKPQSSGQFKPEAFGLGLTLARQALAPYAVSFQVESHPGQGSTITLSIPLKK